MTIIKKSLIRILHFLGVDSKQLLRKKEQALLQQPLKKIKVGRFELLANATHPVQGHLEKHAEFARNLPRIAQFIEQKYPHYAIIDVGANIGDTVAVLRSAAIENAVFCIEPLEGYFRLLEKNSQQFSHVFLYNYWLSDTTQNEVSLNLDVKDGTARYTAEGQTAKLNSVRLDDLVDNQSIKNVKLLKIDTDGFDLKILRGSTRLLEQNYPILFFEYDAVYLEENQENGWDTLKMLRDQIGYDTLLFFDNYGRFLCSVCLSEEQRIKQLLRYVAAYRGKFQYYDVCIFHKLDSDLALKVIENEAQLP